MSSGRWWSQWTLFSCWCLLLPPLVAFSFFWCGCFFFWVGEWGVDFICVCLYVLGLYTRTLKKFPYIWKILEIYTGILESSLTSGMNAAIPKWSYKRECRRPVAIQQHTFFRQLEENWKINFKQLFSISRSCSLLIKLEKYFCDE